MSKKILLIESDSAFARTLANALERVDLETRTVEDGKAGLDAAREWSPDVIVLCVELPGMSGYVICQKLKKDEALRAIPLVLTSSEATTETFEKHQQLKVRADEYLLKPFAPESLLEKLQMLVGLPDGAVAGSAGDEEVVSLEEETDLEALAAEPPGDLPALDLQALPDEPGLGGVAPSGDDEDLRLLDDAFEGLAVAGPRARGAGSGDQVELDEVEVAAASLPGSDEDAGEDLSSLGEETDAALETNDAPRPASEDKPSRGGPRGASADALRAAGIKVLDDAPSAGAGRDGESRALAERLDAAERRNDALGAQLRKAEADLRASRDEARRAKDEADSAKEAADDLRRRVAELEDQARRSAAEIADARDAARTADALEREVDELKTELVVARGEAEGAREEVEKRTAELRRRLQDLESGGSKSEERVVKAYQKIKADEKAREKIRKALSIALQLLDQAPPSEPHTEEERSVGLLGRD